MNEFFHGYFFFPLSNNSIILSVSSGSVQHLKSIFMPLNNDLSLMDLERAV